MALFFQCGCGQDLRADEARAGGRMECPACGCLVPVPSLALDNLRLGIEAAPPLEIPARPAPPPVPAGPACPALPDPGPSRRSASPAWSGKALPPVFPLEPDLELSADQVQRERERQEMRRLFELARQDLQERHRPSRAWPLESNWFECLLYPLLRGWPVLIALALAWAMVVVILVTLLPEEWDLAGVQTRLPLLTPLFLLVSYTCAFFRCVLASAADGEVGFLRWPGGDLLQILWSGAACLLCFLAGPVVPLVVALWFWLESGDLELLDWLILGELGLVAVGYWALALLAVDQSGRLRDANPVAVVRLMRRLEWRGWVMVLLAAAGVVLTFHLTLSALEDLHTGPGGALLLAWWGCCGPAWIVFLLRWYGVSLYHARERRRRQRSPGAEKRSSAPRTRGAHSTPRGPLPPGPLRVS
jgi:hypothetical protein